MEITSAGKAMWLRYLGGTAIETRDHAVGGRMARTDESMLDLVSGGQPIGWMAAGRRTSLPAEQAIRDRLVVVRDDDAGSNRERDATALRNAVASSEDLLSRILR